MFAMWNLALVTCSLLAIAAGRASAQEFVQKFQNPDPNIVSDGFGVSVAMDGELAIVGAWMDGRPVEDIGAAHIYRRINGVWMHERRLDNPDPGGPGSILFGHHVRISRSPHGDVAVVGSPFYSLFTGQQRLHGVAYVYRHDGSDWVLEQRLEPGVPRLFSFFSAVMRIIDDLIVVGAPGSSSIYVYQYFPESAPGERWVETLTAERPADWMPGDNFGERIDLAVGPQGPVIIAGAPGKSDHGVGSGAAYIYRLVDDEWVIERRLDELLLDSASITLLHDSAFCGAQVAISGDVALVGCPGLNIGPHERAGAVFVFRHTGGGNWVWEDTLTHPQVSASFRFGGAIALSGDLALVGAIEDPPNRYNVFLFRHDGAEWTFVEQIINPDAHDDDKFGALAIQHSDALIGAPDDENQPTRGAVYAYRLFNSPIGQDITTSPVDAATGQSPATITFAEITSPGTTTIEITTEAPPLPSGFKLTEPEVFYDIQTSATFDGDITICITYDPTNVPDPEALELRHHNGVEWVDITTTRDPVNNIICGETSSLSPFAIFQPLPATDPLTMLMELSIHVASINIHHGIQNSLDAKLDAALSALESASHNDRPAAANALQAFINQTQAQSGNHIPPEVASDLIARAQAIIAVLNQ